MKNWIETLEQHLIKWLLGIFTTSIGVAVIFYFNATHTMAQNSKDIKEVKAIVKTIDKTPTLNTLKIHQIKKEIQDTKEDVKEISTDFKEFQKQYSKDKDRIIELLMDIKSKK
jgi:septal ring factor EnvC (AmiA/AmiB activator)